jgi:hypothetical protein
MEMTIEELVFMVFMDSIGGTYTKRIASIFQSFLKSDISNTLNINLTEDILWRKVKRKRAKVPELLGYA